MISIPFSLPDAYGGMAEADGILRLNEDSLLFEFQVKDAFFGVVKSDVKSIILNVADIAAIDYKRSIFRGLIYLRSHSVNTVSEIPGHKGGEVRMSIKRKYCDDAEELISSLRLAISEAKLKSLDEQARKNLEQ